MLRRAEVRDVPRIANIINDCAERGLMLHRSLAELYERLRDFQVIEEDSHVLGVVGLRLMWSNLAEVYALAVANEARRRGLGKLLVLGAVDEAEQLGIRKVFALTYEKAFFEKCGFAVVDRYDLPLKVWSECVRCSKHDACDEIAVIRVLEDVPDLGSTLPPTSVMADYDVPVPIEAVRINGQTRR